MGMTAGLDCGPVFHTEEISIGPDETAGELHDRLAALGGATLVEHLDAIASGELSAAEQNDALATYAPKIDKTDAEIDWSLPATEVARRVRAYNPFPGAYCNAHPVGGGLPATVARKAGSHRIKVWRATATDGSAAPGTVLQFDRDGFIVAAAKAHCALTKPSCPASAAHPCTSSSARLTWQDNGWADDGERGGENTCGSSHRCRRGRQRRAVA